MLFQSRDLLQTEIKNYEFTELYVFMGLYHAYANTAERAIKM